MDLWLSSRKPSETGIRRAHAGTCQDLALLTGRLSLLQKNTCRCWEREPDPTLYAFSGQARPHLSSQNLGKKLKRGNYAGTRGHEKISKQGGEITGIPEPALSSSSLPIPPPPPLRTLPKENSLQVGLRKLEEGSRCYEEQEIKWGEMGIWGGQK